MLEKIWKTRTILVSLVEYYVPLSTSPRLLHYNLIPQLTKQIWSPFVPHNFLDKATNSGSPQLLESNLVARRCYLLAIAKVKVGLNVRFSAISNIRHGERDTAWSGSSTVHGELKPWDLRNGSLAQCFIRSAMKCSVIQVVLSE